MVAFELRGNFLSKNQDLLTSKETRYENHNMLKYHRIIVIICHNKYNHKKIN